MDELVLRIKREVLAQLDLSKDIQDAELEDLIARQIAECSREQYLSIEARLTLAQQVYNAMRKLDVIQKLVEDPQISEIMVNGPNCIFYEKEGRMYRFEGRFSSEERLEDIFQQIVARHNRAINLSSPIVDTRLEDGSRVNMVLTPIAIDGSALTIRKFPSHPMDMAQLLERGAITEEAACLLKQLIEERYSILISGGTGSGKTTFLNALSQYIPGDERIITIEDSAELQLLEIENLVRLETRNSNCEGAEAITIRDLIRTSLRMRPDRIIVGECRGAEAFDMLQAMNTGHNGSLSTIHANSCVDVLSRLEMMVLMGMDLPLLAVRKQIASGVDIIVHLGRMRDKSRKVLEIVKLEGIKDGEIVLNPLFRRVKGNLVKCGELIHSKEVTNGG